MPNAGAHWPTCLGPSRLPPLGTPAPQCTRCRPPSRALHRGCGGQGMRRSFAGTVCRGKRANRGGGGGAVCSVHRECGPTKRLLPDRGQPGTGFSPARGPLLTPTCEGLHSRPHDAHGEGLGWVGLTKAAGRRGWRRSKGAGTGRAGRRETKHGAKLAAGPPAPWAREEGKLQGRQS